MSDHPYSIRMDGVEIPVFGACIAVSRTLRTGIVALVTPEDLTVADAIAKGLHRLPADYFSMLNLLDPGLAIGRLAASLKAGPMSGNGAPFRPDGGVLAALYARFGGMPFFVIECEPDTTVVKVSGLTFPYPDHDLLPSINEVLQGLIGSPQDEVPTPTPAMPTRGDATLH